MYLSDEDEIEAVRRVLSARKLFRYRSEPGECDLFEREFAARLGVGHALLVSSGTNALLAALTGLGLGEGDEVLVPAYTFVATAAAVRMAGAQPVVVNIDDTLGFDLADAESKLNARTKAMIPVHMDGLAVDMTAVMTFAERHELLVIEDCAQALGGSCDGRALGAWGHAAAFSLNENKSISCGEGGIAVTSKREVFERTFAAHDLAARYNPIKGAIGAPHASGVSHSMRVSEIQGAIARVQLRRLDGILENLRARKAILAAALEPVPEVSVPRGGWPAGDCGSSLHIAFTDPGRAKAAGIKLAESGLAAIFPSLRPAHVAWKWLPQIDPAAAATATIDLLPSVARLMSVLKYDIDFTLSLSETEAVARRLRAAVMEAVG